jgi:WD40 repeat protein
VALTDATYALDAVGGLHVLDGKSWSVVDHGIHRITGSGDVLLVCRINGELNVERRGVVVERRRCARTLSPDAIAVAGDDYAALSDDGTLFANRAGRSLELATGIVGEYELALSSTGAVAIAGYVADGKTWLLSPESAHLEAGPVHASQPYSVAADGGLVAWGYEDGTVIARDLASGRLWELHGHAEPVYFLVIDAANERVISATLRELRVWDVKQVPSEQIAKMPCSVFHVEPSPDATQAALDCNDGSVWVWSRSNGQVVQIHKHVGYSHGLQWLNGSVCSGGWGDGRVQCSSPDGASRVTLDSQSRKVTGLTATPDQSALVFGASDGKVWRFDRGLRSLYAHGGPVYLAAISADGRLLASCAQDGSLAVFDLVNDRLITQVVAHRGEFCSVGWEGRELWSSGGEGTLKRWTVQNERLALDHMVQVAGALRHVQRLGGGWAAVEGTSVVLVSRDGASVALRIDIGRNVTALDVSPDRRYVAASTNGELVVIDLERNAIATLATGAPVQQLRFLEPGLIAFSEPAALKTLRVDALAYEAFEPAPEPPNRASF